MKKPAIPAVPKPGSDRARFDTAVKECLELLMARRGGKTVELTTTDAISLKVNEILARLQD